VSGPVVEAVEPNASTATLSAAPLEVPHLRRNFLLGVTNGAMFGFAEALMSIDTVLTWFVHQLAGSNFLVGLVGPMRDAGWYLPQLFTSHRLQRRAQKLPVYRRMALIRTTAWLTWTLSAFFVKDAAALLFLFFVAYAVNALAAGVSGLPFMDIVAKTIPSRRRGAFFGGRTFYGGLLGLGASFIVAWLLSENSPVSFPLNVAWLFLLSWLAASAGLLLFSRVIEPEGEVRLEEVTLRSHVQRAATLPRQDRNLRFYLIARTFSMLSYVAAPFYAVYSINVLGAPAEILGVYVGARTVAALAINPVWARLSDQRGNRLVVSAATICGLAIPVWAIFVPLIATALRADSTLISLAFVPVFIFSGLYETGMTIGANNLLLELSPGNDRSIYVGLTNTILGIAYFSTTVSGLLADWLGYLSVFGLALIFYLVALWAISRVREPRELEAAP
jgi:hypothetical protein